MGQDLQDLAPQIEIPEPFHDLSKLSHSVICQAWVVLLPLTFEGHMYCIPVVAHSGTWLSHEIMLCTIVIRNIKPTSCHWKKWEILRKVRKVFIGSFFFFFAFATIISLKTRNNDKNSTKVGSPRPRTFGPPGKHKLANMRGNVLLLTVARIAKRLRKLLALSRAWHCESCSILKQNSESFFSNGGEVEDYVLARST